MSKWISAKKKWKISDPKGYDYNTFQTEITNKEQ